MASACKGAVPGPEQFPAGLKVLVVDDDIPCLIILEQMLRKCMYSVTTCSQATVALNLLRERKGIFDIVLSDVHMPDMDGFKLLELVGLEMDLPVIMMSGDERTSLVMRGIRHGACDFLIKPIRTEELKNIWQHVVRKRCNMGKELEHSGGVEDNDNDRLKNGIDDAEYTTSFNGGADGVSKSLKKRKGTKEEDDTKIENDDPTTSKKPRIVWSIELHQQFVSAINHLGIDKAEPVRILELMNVLGLTKENVASHLQKYRLYLERLSRVAQPQAGLPTFSVQPSCLVVPAHSSANLHTGNSLASANQSCSLSGTSIVDYSILSPQSNISPLNSGRMGDAETKPASGLGGFSVASSASRFGPAKQLSAVVPNRLPDRVPYMPVLQNSHGLPKSTDLGRRWTSILSRFAMSDMGLPVSNVNQQKLHGESNGNYWSQMKSFLSWGKSICLHRCYICLFFVLCFIFIYGFPSHTIF